MKLHKKLNFNYERYLHDIGVDLVWLPNPLSGKIVRNGTVLCSVTVARADFVWLKNFSTVKLPNIYQPVMYHLHLSSHYPISKHSPTTNQPLNNNLPTTYAPPSPPWHHPHLPGTILTSLAPSSPPWHHPHLPVTILTLAPSLTSWFAFCSIAPVNQTEVIS
jgi:hypothetical protein